ncbi:TerD family protein [Streptomyces avicenniae]|uniref:TerD family protein n=1 Tax=Streptomyces avicenniae TaxID=500153 RepID=UPI00069B3506|nr:TerD family protein [Streptomyces avicenniae]
MSLASPLLQTSLERAHAHEWALVDVETSGLIARRDRVLSVAVVTLGPDGTVAEEFSTLLDPGCDPGPVHIHGLTRERLRGSPTFDQVAGRMAAMLEGRVLVAHNAQFDYDFLAHEFARARSWLPVTRRLCTLALNRRVDPPTDDLRLGTLAAYYGVPQVKAHDALDDTRVLAGILRATLDEAARLGVPLPLVDCPPRQDARFMPQPPKSPCAYRNPGRLLPGAPLVQGMKVAITGWTETARAELVGRSVAAGLNVVTSVSGLTSALVSNEPASASGKARRAAECGVPVLDEATFVRLLGDVRPGVPHERSGDSPVSGTRDVRDTVVPAERPLAGRRVLVLGGGHTEAVAVRGRVVELGGAAAVNVSASVTDVVSLPGGDADRRMGRIASRGIPVHDAAWLDAPGPRAHARREAPGVVPRGGVVDLPGDQVREAPWTVTATWAQGTACAIDVVAFVVDEEEHVAFDEDFVFYGAPENPGGTVRLFGDGPTEQTVSVSLATLPPSAHKVVIAAAIDGTATFGDVGAVEISAGPGTSATPLVRSTLDAATTERTLVLAELYRRGPVWRLRAVGQGYDHGLADLARGYGVDIED